MKSVPTSFSTQKSMTCLVGLCRRSRIRRSARRHCLFLARCSFFHRREYFLQRDCFLAILPTKVLITLSFERTDPTPGDDQGPGSRGGDCGQMDFTKINRCAVLSCSFLRLWNLDTHMQLKAVVPGQHTGSAVLRQLKQQNQRFPTLAHR